MEIKKNVENIIDSTENAIEDALSETGKFVSKTLNEIGASIDEAGDYVEKKSTEAGRYINETLDKVGESIDDAGDYVAKKLVKKDLNIATTGETKTDAVN
jgi:hypothetical protein